MHARLRLGISVCLCLILSACGSNSSVSPGPPRVEITPNQDNVVEGGQLQFTAAEFSASGVIVNNDNFIWASDDTSIVTIDSNGLATAGVIGIARITATSGTLTGSATIGVVKSTSGGVFTLSGKAEYEDKPFDQTGFIGSPVPTPIRNAVIKVIAIDGFRELASGVTNNAGDYNFTTPMDNSNWRAGVYLRVVAQTNPPKIEIRNNLTDNALLAMISDAFDDNPGGTFTNKNVLAPTTGIGGAFNILDVFLKGDELICPPPTPGFPCPLPLLTGYWEPGGSEGTFFTTLGYQQPAIFLCGGGAGDFCTPIDTDEYDDAVIAHEYGHFALSQFSHDDSPGGFHAISENGQDIRLSWSEGWANFFSNAVLNSQIYVDTIVGGTRVSFNLENYTSIKFSPPSSLGIVAIYTTSEIAVAGVLWDILDGALSTDGDPLNLTFNQILQTVMNIPPLPTPATMETFWLQFSNDFSAETFPDDLETIMKKRQIELFPDAGEAAEQNLIVNTPQHHTLYRDEPDPTGDIDTIQFNVVGGNIYTLKTFNLTNGADTILTIKDGINVLFQHDNVGCLSFPSCPPNDKTTLSSSITWTPAMDMLLTAEVKRSPIAPPSAGQFGSYDIELTTP